MRKMLIMLVGVAGVLSSQDLCGANFGCIRSAEDTAVRYAARITGRISEDTRASLRAATAAALAADNLVLPTRVTVVLRTHNNMRIVKSSCFPSA